MFLCRPRRTNPFRDQSSSPYSFGFYGCLLCLLLLFLILFLRDTTPVVFVSPTIADMLLPQSDFVNSATIDNVYWRVSIRHINGLLSDVCQHENYMVLTNKNIQSDNVRMTENYIYLCTPISNIQSMINARIVVSTSSTTKTVRCKESYGEVSKTVIRQYPFSLKYIDAEQFQQQTKVIRTAQNACTILHAIDVIQSKWE